MLSQSITRARRSEIDPIAFRTCLGSFPTGVCVVTARDGEEKLGMTMSSFNSLSLDPPLVLFSVDRRAKSLAGWRRAPGYAVNILAEDQIEISNRFARSLADKWGGVEHEEGLAGAPILGDVAAVFECAPHEIVEGGDHLLFVARVERFRQAAGRRPLVFHKGAYGRMADERGPAAEQPLHLGW